MKKKNQIGKLKLSKKTIGNLTELSGGRPPQSLNYSNCAVCEPVDKYTDDCPHSIPHTNCICTGDRTYFDYTCGSCY
jgi:hypothetical protein